MTDDELKQIEERCNAATPGPWRWEQDFQDLHSEADASIVINARVDITYTSQVEWMDIETEDADFIAHSRTDIPALIADNKALKEANFQLQMQLDSMQRLMQNYLDNYGLTQEFENWSNASS